MPRIPSLIEETGRTAAGLLLTQRPDDEHDETAILGGSRGGRGREGSPAAAQHVAVAAARNPETLILDSPVAFLSQIRHFIPHTLFVKRMHSTDFRIFAAQCLSAGQRPGELLTQFIAHANLSTVSVTDLVNKTREERDRHQEEKRHALEAKRAEREQKRQDRIVKKIMIKQEQKQKKLQERRERLRLLKGDNNNQNDDDGDGDAAAANGEEDEEAHLEVDADEADSQNDKDGEEETGDDCDDATTVNHLAQVTADAAIAFIRRSRSPVDAARALFGSLYCSILQISASVWSAMVRAQRARDLQRVVERNATGTTSSARAAAAATTNGDNSSNNNRSNSKLPPLVGRRAPSNNANNNSNSISAGSPLSINSASAVSNNNGNDRVGHNFILDHSHQKLGGIPRAPIPPIRASTAHEHSMHDSLAAMKSDELRSHVPLVSFDSRDSAAAWELSCIDFSMDRFPALSRFSSYRMLSHDEQQQQHAHETKNPADHKTATAKALRIMSHVAAEDINDPDMSASLRRAVDHELNLLSQQVRSLVNDCFEFSPEFLAPTLTQCLVVLRGWYSSVQNEADASLGRGGTTRATAAASTSSTTQLGKSAAELAAQEVAGTHPASSAMCALLGVEPRVPAPYVVSIDGRAVHIPHPLPSHSVLVATALQHQSRMASEKQKHRVKLLRAQNEKILELQRRSMRPRNEPRPAPHVPGRKRILELGFFSDEVDSQNSLESILKLRYNSATSSVLKKQWT